MARHSSAVTSTAHKILVVAIFSSLLSGLGFAQSGSALPDPPSTQTISQPDNQSASSGPGTAMITKDCVEPEPVFTGLKYDGPFKKVVVRLSGKPDIRTVHLHEGQGRICTLPVRQKFNLFVRDT